MDPITHLPGDIDSDSALWPADPPGDLTISDIPAEPVATDAVGDAETQLFQAAQSPAPVEPPPPSSLARAPGKRLVPDDMAALHPKGGYIAMRLLSRMQTDLAVLTGDKRPATYDEVEEYLGHALVAEEIAPRGYTAEQAAKWWAMGGSAALRAPGSGGRDGDTIAIDNARSDAEAPPPSGAFADIPRPWEGDHADGIDAPHIDRDAWQASAVETAAADDSESSGDVETVPDSAAGMRDDSAPVTDGEPGEPAGLLEAATKRTKAKRPKVQIPPDVANALKQSRVTVAAVAATAKTQVAAAFGTDLSTVDKGFGDRAHAFRGDYRTRPEARAWLPEFESRAGPEVPYADGSPGSGMISAAGRRKIRADVAYLYTLPEVKAFLDLYAHTEGADKDGYYLSHNGRPRLRDLKAYYGGDDASGRYQIKGQAWKDYGVALWSRKDFSEITQDLVAITLLRQKGAIDELLKGNLSGAMTLAAPVFASGPVSATEDYSFYPISRPHTDPKTGAATKFAELQPTPIRFRDLPAEFARHLQYRQAEFRQAEQAWRANGILPKAFIPPTRWRSFGLDGFDTP
ncbi:MAG: hypothetical protein ABI810_06750 [Sphingomonas bacterium]